MKPFLDVIWQDLLVINYRLHPDYVYLLEKHLPKGTELDDFGGEHYVSVVAFRFRKTHIMGIPIPLYRDFAEVNLRFYVKRAVDGGWRRGVVFIQEIIRHRLPALVANRIFHENFHTHPLTHKKEENLIRYEWSHDGYQQKLEGRFENKPEIPNHGTLEQHIIDHYWAYKAKGNDRTLEFHVQHRPWRVQPFVETSIELDLGRVYGSEWKHALSEKPVSIFYADGSRVGVTRPRKINQPK